MEIIGKIIFDLGERGGTSKAGKPWNTHEYVLETEESIPRKVHFDFFGEKANQYVLKPGDRIRLSFDIDSREYNGRWFTSIRGWKSEMVGDGPVGAASAAPAAAPAYPSPEPPVVQAPAADTGDDLPF